MKKTEIFTELSIQLARIEAKLDKLLEQNKSKEIKIKSFPEVNVDPNYWQYIQPTADTISTTYLDKENK